MRVMLLESIEPHHYGPFAFPVRLELEPDVTVLTGPNDAGKTSLLRLIARICRAEGLGPLAEWEFNQDSLHDNHAIWQQRGDFGCIVQAQIGDEFLSLLPPLQKLTQRVTIRCNIAPQNAQQTIIEQFGDNGRSLGRGDWKLNGIPIQAIWLPPRTEVRDTIDCLAPTDVELKLFRVALGPEFKFEQLYTLPANNLAGQLGRAEDKLNRHLKEFLPASLGIEWALRSSADGKSIHCFLRDRLGGYTALGIRGAGVRKVMAILAWLMSYNFKSSHSVVLFDEPETSLHAESQHLLREVLENLGEKPNIQVIYATHSPSMVNVMRPHSIRLFKRIITNGRANTTIENRPFADNFLPVRTSLGLTAADSLLYAPLTVIVEGDTEAIGLPLLLFKLADSQVPGFENVRHLLSQTRFLDGMGDRYPFTCQMAKSQGTKPIIFLDGDKKQRRASQKLDESLSDVPVVTLPQGTEFEQLVPPESYFAALATVIHDEAGRLTLEGFRAWEETTKPHEKMMFTKRIEKWLEGLGLPDPNKAQTMRKAVELTDVSQVNTAPLLEMVRHLERRLAAFG